MAPGNDSAGKPKSALSGLCRPQRRVQSSFVKIMSPATELRENREFASEIKFLVSPSLADQIRDWARGRLAPDPNAAGEAGHAYPVTDLYFDTGEVCVFHRKGSFARDQ